MYADYKENQELPTFKKQNNLKKVKMFNSRIIKSDTS